MKPPTQLLTKQDLAKRLGVSRPTLDSLVAEGMPVVSTPATNRKQGYRFDAVACEKWFSARQKRIADCQPSLQSRIFSALHKEFWSLSRPLMRPDDLRLVRDGCRTTDDLIRTGFRMGKSIGKRLEELADTLWLAEHPEDGE